MFATILYYIIADMYMMYAIALYYCWSTYVCYHIILLLVYDYVIYSVLHNFLCTYATVFLLYLSMLFSIKKE